jgi:hypothetical protein
VDLAGNQRQLQITASGETEFATPSALNTVLKLNATIPSTAPTNAPVQAIRLSDVTVGIPSGPTVNEVAALGDIAVHQVGYFGDANNSGGANPYTGTDVTLMQRNVNTALQASGFNAYRNTDPVIVADINGSGSITGADVSQMQQRVLNQVVAAIPPVTAPSAPITTSTETLQTSQVTTSLQTTTDSKDQLTTLFGDRPIQ